MPALKVYNGTTWEYLTGGAAILQQASAPASPVAGDLWIDTDEVAQSGTSASLVVLAETTLGSAATHIEFASISSSYKHLRIEGRIRSDRTSNDSILMRVGNGSVDTGSNYTYRNFWPGVTLDTDTASASSVEVGRALGTNATADLWAYLQCDIQDYRTTTYWRMIRSQSWLQEPAAVANGSSQTIGHWKNKAAAIDVVRVFPGAGTNFIAGSQLRLIGIPAP